MTSPERVVITGVGCVSPAGLSAHSTFEAMLAGRSGVHQLPWPIAEGMEVRVGASVAGFEAPIVSSLPAGMKLGRLPQFVVAAAREAIADAGLLDAGYPSSSIATILGVGLGCAEPMEESFGTFRSDGNLDALDPLLLERMSPTLPLELVALEVNATGPNWCTVSACASSAHAIGRAFELVRNGVVDAAVTGGGEAGLSPFILALFERLSTLSRYEGTPEQASRPFDARRDGFVVGEGAGILILESLTKARRRNARIYAELAGYGASSDAFHVTRPAADGGGMALAMETALRVARIDPERVDYVNAHGTGTEFNDVSETLAIKRVFGDRARKIAISSNKSMIGHLLGGAAAVEMVAAAQTLASGKIPPTINLEYPDKDCDLDYVPLVAREQRVRVIVKNSFGFGGQNGSLVLAAV